VHTNLQHLSAGSGVRLGKSWTVLIVAQVAVAVAVLPVVLHTTLVQPKVKGFGGPVIPTNGWITATAFLDREASLVESARDDSSFARRYAAVQMDLVRRLDAEPGVADVVLAETVPGDESGMQVELDSVATRAASRSGDAKKNQSASLSRVDLDFFRAFGVPVLSGRALESRDLSANATAVVVNHTFVRQFIGAGNPLGRRVRKAARGAEGSAQLEPSGPWYEIVGVVADFPTPASTDDERAKMYNALLPGAMPVPVSVAVRVKGAAPTLFTGRLREIAVAVDPMLRLSDVRPLDDALSIGKMANRVIFTAVALVTLSVVLLSAAGIYALLSFTIVRRRREIGIRSALGARPRQVVAGVLRRVARQIGLGIAIGIGVSALLVQSLEGWKGNASGVLVLIGVAVFMGAIGIAAAWGPARQALSIQPTEALRSE
jgi:hypothetical protein